MIKSFNTKKYTYFWFIISVCIIILILTLNGFFEYKKSIENASIKTTNLAILLSKKLESDFENTNNLLNFAHSMMDTIVNENKYFLEANEKEKKEIISKRFATLINNSKNITILNYADSNGNIIYSSNYLTDGINISDRQHFIELKNNNYLTTSFSEVITSRTTGKESLVVAHAIRDENGNLSGIITAVINIKNLNETLASIELGKDGVSLLRRSDNTKLITRYPNNDNIEANHLLPLNNPIIVRIKAGEKTGTLEYVASTDGKKRIGSFIVMDNFPFYVQTAISEDVYLAHWKDNLKIVATLFVLFIFVAFLIFIVLNKSFKKEQLAVKELLKNQTLFSSGPVITIEWIPQNNWPIKNISNNCINILGYTKNEMLSKDFNYSNLIHPDDKQKVYEEVDNFIRNNINSFEQSYRIQLKNGTYKHFYDYTKIIRDEKNEIINYIGYIFDQTNLKEKEKSLLVEKNRFENMFKNHASIMLLIDPNNGEIVDANQSAVNFYGYVLDELKQMNISKINQSSMDELKENYQEAKNSIKKSFIFSHKLKNGEIKIVEVNSSPIETSHGIILFSIIKDITTEKIVQKKLQEFYENLEKLIETQDNIITLTNGKEIKFANHKFFDFLGFENLEIFKKHHLCICEFFIEDDRFFHLKKINANDNWITKIIELDESKRIVSIMGKNSKQYIFSVNVNTFDEDTMIISFTDVTHAIFENIYLEEKILHDKLTNAYNREYFDKNYKKFIYASIENNKNLALAILDIDHFKKVNDTYGHDIGDEVLIKFVKTIQKNLRKDDILIRWGGEEFILILQLDSKKDLEQKLEHLKRIIELEPFPKISNITCSIGGTIYLDNENILKTIKRADQAVYEAKATGRNRVIIE